MFRPKLCHQFRRKFAKFESYRKMHNLIGRIDMCWFLLISEAAELQKTSVETLARIEAIFNRSVLSEVECDDQTIEDLVLSEWGIWWHQHVGRIELSQNNVGHIESWIFQKNQLGNDFFTLFLNFRNIVSCNAEILVNYWNVTS